MESYLHESQLRWNVKGMAQTAAGICVMAVRGLDCTTVYLAHIIGHFTDNFAW